MQAFDTVNLSTDSFEFSLFCGISFSFRDQVLTSVDISCKITVDTMCTDTLKFR